MAQTSVSSKLRQCTFKYLYWSRLSGFCIQKGQLRTYIGRIYPFFQPLLTVLEGRLVVEESSAPRRLCSGSTLRLRIAPIYAVSSATGSFGGSHWLGCPSHSTFYYYYTRVAPESREVERYGRSVREPTQRTKDQSSKGSFLSGRSKGPHKNGPHRVVLGSVARIQ